MNNPLVSVIIPTKNSSETLEACLKSIREQSYKNIEIVVVDNNSTDDTKEVAKKYTDKVFNLGPERSAQRNFGVEKSEGQYVLIVDSDMKLSEKVIESCLNKISSDSSIKGLVIPEESYGEGFWAQCKKLERSFYVGVDWMEAARFFDKEMYLKVGGYNEEMVSGEDWDFSQRFEREARIDRIDYFIYHNEGNLSLIKTLKKKYYYAEKFCQYVDKNKNDNKIKSQTGVIQRYGLFLSQPKKLLKNPFFGLGMLFMKTCEFGFGSIAVLKNKIYE